MYSEIKQTVIKNLFSIHGWRTKRKIVVIESDDWGSIRMPSKDVYKRMLQYGIRVDKCHYNRFDTLASEVDLEDLFDTLIQFKDINGNHPIITANTIVANPDFQKIKDSGFEIYYYEPFIDTLKRYPGCEKSFEIWKQGIVNKLFWPQFHGREHLNVNRWMGMLKKKSEETLIAFENNLFGISTNITKEKRKSYLAAFDFDNPEELEWQKEVLIDGLNLFENIFGYRSNSYIATNYVWHSDLEPVLYKNGIKYIQGSGNHLQPNGMKNKVIRHFLGSKNSYGQTYLTRNCVFEPSELVNKDWIDSVLREIEIAFLWRKPVVISSHRLNYIGSIDSSNRYNNLKLLKNLLGNILKNWPDIEFMTSDLLGKEINN